MNRGDVVIAPFPVQDKFGGEDSQEKSMQTVTLEEAQSHLGEIIDKLTPGEEVVLTRGDKPVARIVAGPGEMPRPVPGRGKGMLMVISEDDDHLRDFAEYMP